ncbi:helix-turn-helix domain-containing protein [Candidatus Margulisiibacteriota bacterium]
MSKLKDLKRKQLSETLKAGGPVPIEKLGQRLRDIREGLGLTQKQLAEKLSTSQAQLSRMEENPGATTLKSLVKLVTALGCNLSGVVTSEKSLAEIINKQAKKKAEQMLKRTFANMAMEKQAPEKKAYNFQLKKLIAELAANPGPELWEE